MIQNPYYNPQLSQNSYTNFLQGAQNTAKGIYTNPSTWATNPVLAGSALAVDAIASPLQDTAMNKGMIEQLSTTDLPDEQYDSQGNQIYNMQGYQQGINDVQGKSNDYWGDNEGLGKTALNFISPGFGLLNSKDKVRGVRGIAQSLGIGKKKREKEQATINNKQQDLLDSKQDFTEYNTMNTNRINSDLQRYRERNRRLSNLNNYNIY